MKALRRREGPSLGRATLIPLLVVLATACSEMPTEPVPPRDPATHLSIVGPQSLGLGGTANFRAVVLDSAGRLVRDVTFEVLWISSDPGVLTVSRGAATGLSPGHASVEALLGGERAALAVSVDLRPGELSAALAIDSLTVIVFGPDARGSFGYSPRFLLKETGGKSGATILGVTVIVNGGGDSTGPSCWEATLRVPPGGTLDTFYTDEGFKWLSYCVPWSGGGSSHPDILVRVTFVDDAGHGGTVEAASGRN